MFSVQRKEENVLIFFGGSPRLVRTSGIPAPVLCGHSDMADHLTEEQTAEFREAFALFDKVTPKEASSALSLLFITCRTGTGPSAPRSWAPS